MRQRNLFSGPSKHAPDPNTMKFRDSGREMPKIFQGWPFWCVLWDGLFGVFGEMNIAAFVKQTERCAHTLPRFQPAGGKRLQPPNHSSRPKRPRVVSRTQSAGPLPCAIAYVVLLGKDGLAFDMLNNFHQFVGSKKGGER